MHRRLVARWSLHARLAHWGFALAFFGLLISGLALGNPDLRGIPFLGSKLVREIHLTWAVLLFILPALAASWDGFWGARRFWRESSQFNARDWNWLAAILLARRPPPQGRLNAGQKLNMLALLALIGGLTLTGALVTPEAGRPVPQAIRVVLYEVHVLLAYATVPLVLGHVFLATLFPPTRAALRGIVLGSVDAEWASRHHALWATSPAVEESDGSEPATAAP
jgi:formate dehydrogenase gamma subunit